MADLDEKPLAFMAYILSKMRYSCISEALVICTNLDYSMLAVKTNYVERNHWPSSPADCHH